MFTTILQQHFYNKFYNISTTITKIEIFDFLLAVSYCAMFFFFKLKENFIEPKQKQKPGQPQPR